MCEAVELTVIALLSNTTEKHYSQNNFILLSSPPTQAQRTMQQKQGSFENYNSGLVSCLQELRQKREQVHKEVLSEEREKERVQKQLAELTEQLHRLNGSIQHKAQSRNDYDKTIQETEAAYMKILESSQTLLHVLKRETQNLTKKSARH